MSSLAEWNPFQRRSSYSDSEIMQYRIWTAVSFLLSAVTTLAYVLHPLDSSAHPIWWWNKQFRTAFTLNPVIVSVYWLALYVNQASYLSSLWNASANETAIQGAALGSHFIVNNILTFVITLLFSHGHFLSALILQIINLFNLTVLYHRHRNYARWLHWPVVSGPLAWTIIAILWTGAIVAPWSDALILRIMGNVAIWAILLIGLFFLGVYGDYTMGFSLAVLTWALAMGQFWEKIIALQWIFAFVIMGVLFLASFAVAIPIWTGRQVAWLNGAEEQGRIAASQGSEGERRPLIGEQQA
ncbi:hypothetical protein TD95_002240 [Thielaviopsis punctulata]|uniref:DUF1774-domain-containing protein n=1 Tax=Thielaviopsis punctulata TaxID=72032 RepID=A0A0F4ZDD9_9PEZI|nr:hypothetical protein TD95_002240 [Thielaviopsis punctulata]